MLDSYRELIDDLLGTPKVLRDLVANGAPPEPVVRMIGELRDRDAAVRARLQTMLRQQNAVLKPIVLDAAVQEDVAATLDGFDTERGELVSLLMNLTLKDWERTAIDEHGAETNMTEEVENHVEFDEAQVEKIEAGAE